MARGGVSSRPDAWVHSGGLGGECAAARSRFKLARRCLSPRPGVGVRADRTGSQMQREGPRKGDGSELYFETKRKKTQESVQWVYAGFLGPVPAWRRGREVSDGGRFRQQDSTPSRFFRLTPAFGLRSLPGLRPQRWKNGYVRDVLSKLVMA